MVFVMSEMFVDSFDHYDAATGPQKWNSWTSGTMLSGTNTAFNRGQCVSDFNGSHTFSTSYDSFVFGYRYFRTSTAAEIQRVSLGGSLSGMVWGTTIDSAGKLVLKNHASSPIWTLTSTGVLSVGSWNYFEGGLKIANSGGHVRGRINGVQDATLTFDGDTQGGGGAGGPTFDVSAFFNLIATGRLDDYYFMAGSGFDGTDAEFLGEGQIVPLYFDGAGAQDDFTAVGAATSWEAMDETLADNDTSYATGSTVGQRMWGNIQDLAPSQAIKLWQRVTQARKTDTAARQFSQGMRNGAGTISDGVAQTLSTSWGMFRRAGRFSPFTGGATEFTVAEINALQIGPKIEL